MHHSHRQWHAPRHAWRHWMKHIADWPRDWQKLFKDECGEIPVSMTTRSQVGDWLDTGGNLSCPVVLIWPVARRSRVDIYIENSVTCHVFSSLTAQWYPHTLELRPALWSTDAEYRFRYTAEVILQSLHDSYCRIYHCMCAETATYQLPVKIRTSALNSAIRFCHKTRHVDD